jgi:signal transduction histidine kinase
VKPAVREPDIPAVLAADLATFSFGGRHEHRVRIEGVVTARSSGQEVFLRSGQTALGVRFSAPTAVAEGDRIVAVGFTEMGRFSAWLVDARLVQQSPGAALPPRELGLPEIMSGTPDADLVSVTAVLTGLFRGENGVTLTLEGQGGTLQARGPPILEEIPLRSVVRVTGICQVESTTSVILTSRPQTVTLRLRSPGDLAVLKSPPWWTPRRLAVALVSLLGAMLVAVLWIVALRRQVRIHTHALQEKIKDEAVLEERHRIAREFHDSLEQDLTGLALRLSAAATRALDEKGRKIVEISCGLLARIQAETRNYVSDLREPAETHGDFAAALEAIAAQRDGIDGVEVRVDFSGPLPALSPAANHHLRMMARESLTNAMRHAHASRILITVSVANEILRLRISDDGCGFDVASETHGRAGHFGCIGMRERARKIGATIAWRSEPGAGTSVEIVLPLPATTEAARRRPPPFLPRASAGHEPQDHPPCPVTPPRS